MSSTVRPDIQSGPSLPPEVGVYKRPPTASLPKIAISSTSRDEAVIMKFFKCTKYGLKGGHKCAQCFATRNHGPAFVDHLRAKHPKQTFYCIYCYPSPNSDEKQIEDLHGCRDLVDHMIRKHRHRVYQCNLCLYRAISANHVNIHQELTHPAIYEQTVATGRLLDGKICRIFHCQAIRTESEGPPLGEPFQHYAKHRSKRLNQTAPKDTNFQCLYCQFMSESQREVLQHLCQYHADYHIMYYKPENGTAGQQQTPATAPVLSEIDMFHGNPETQVNRISSTDVRPAVVVDLETINPELEAEKSSLMFKPKKYVSNVQSSQQKRNAGLSSKTLNKEPTIPAHMSRGPYGAAHRALPIGRRPGPASKTRFYNTTEYFVKKAEIQRKSEQKKAQTNRRYESDSESDGNERRPPVSPLQPSAQPKVVKPSGNRDVMFANRSLPNARKSIPPPPGTAGQQRENQGKPYLSARHMVCRLCDGNVRDVQPGGGSAHISMFHQKLKKRAPNAWVCGYCLQFLAIEDAEIKVHQVSRCPNKPRNPDPSKTSYWKLLVPKGSRASLIKPKPSPIAIARPQTQPNSTRRRSPEPVTRPAIKTQPNATFSKSMNQNKLKIKPKRTSSLRYLTDDDDSDNPDIDVDLTRPSTSRGSGGSGGNRTPRKHVNRSPPVAIYESQAKRKLATYMPDMPLKRMRQHSSDDSLNSFINDGDSGDDRPTVRTKKTTTIEVAQDSDDDQQEPVQYVCLFCDQTTSQYVPAYEHLESHFPAIVQKTDDYIDSQRLREWFKEFLYKQTELFNELKDDEEASGPYNCPICVRIARTRLTVTAAKPYDRYYKLMSHLWQHSFWSPVLCRLCKMDNRDVWLPNNDHDIAKHLNDRHYDQLGQADLAGDVIGQLRCNKVRNGFTEEQRQELVDREFIVVTRHDVLDVHIEDTLKSIVADNERRLRESHLVPDCELPIDRLPELNFYDDLMVKRYVRKVNQTGPPEGEVLEVKDLTSGSDWDSDDNDRHQQQKNYKRVSLLVDDSDDNDDQRSDGNGSDGGIDCEPEVIDDSDSDIEIIDEKASTSKSMTNKSVAKANGGSDDNDSDDSDVKSSKVTNNDNQSKAKESVPKRPTKVKDEPNPPIETPVTVDDITSDTINEDRQVDDKTLVPKISPTKSDDTPTKPSGAPNTRFLCHHCDHICDTVREVKRHSSANHPGQSMAFSRQ